MLNRKLIRDFSASKWLFVAVAMVIFLGVAFFGASFLGYRNLKTSYDYTYETLRFADFAVTVVEAPDEALEELESISGVKAVTGRMNSDIALTLSGDEARKVLARVISLPSDSRAAVNDVKVEEGVYFEEGDTGALLVEKSFAEYHDLRPEDVVQLTVGSQETSFRIAGIVVSPEYIWAAKSRQELLPTPETFGVFFVPQDAVPGLMGGSFVNEFCFLIDEEADRDAVIAEVESALEPYAVTDVVTREDQPSNAALSMDLQEFGEMAEVFPLLFLIVGALATYILLTRIVYKQRSQIGLMRAVGYSRRKVLIHYLSFALIIGVLGAVPGTVAGYLLSEGVTSLYVGFLNLPYTRIEMGWIEWLAIEEGLLLGILPCVIAGIMPARAAAKLIPAEAMRTPPPAAGRRLLLERVLPFLGRLSARKKIPLRNVFRNRRRSLYTVIGITFGISLILVSAAFIDSIDYFMSLQFDRIQKYDAQINFAQPQSVAVVDEVSGWDETGRVEPILQVPSRLQHRDETYSTLLVGLPHDSELYGLYSAAGDRVSVDDEGVLLGEGLRKTLDVAVGDVIDVQSPYAVSQLEVVGFVKQALGGLGYVSLQQAQTMAGEEGVVSGLMLSVEPEYLDSIRDKAYAIPGTASVELTAESYDKVSELMGFLRGMMWVMLGFGAAMALAIVFTVVTINILERSREVATMRTMGEGRGRIAAMITIENLILGLAGLLPGIGLGYALALFFFRLIQGDMFNFSVVIFPRTYALTVGIVILIMLVSQIPGIRQVNRLDLAKVIKEQVS